MRDLILIDGLKPSGTHKKKRQIILTHSSRNIKDYLVSLRTRYNGEYKKLPHYVIGRDGETFQLIQPHTYSEYFPVKSYNKNAIVICLENLGWLRKHPLSGGYVNWIGDSYKGSIFEKKWRGHHFWHPYTDEQIESLVEIINYLCDEFDIPKISLGHNVKIDKAENFNGIVCNSNFDSDNTDLNPAFNFDIFIKKIDYEQSI